jgi:hypothetical protein
MEDINVARLENYYDFQCEAGPLKNCQDWISLKAELAALRSLVREMGKQGVSGQGTLWFCGFCGNHGAEQLHYDDCILNRPKVKVIMEDK